MCCVQNAAPQNITNVVNLRLTLLAESRALTREQESLRALMPSVFRILKKRPPLDLIDGFADIAHDSLETRQFIANTAMLLMFKTQQDKTGHGTAKVAHSTLRVV